MEEKDHKPLMSCSYGLWYPLDLLADVATDSLLQRHTPKHSLVSSSSTSSSCVSEEAAQGFLSLEERLSRSMMIPKKIRSKVQRPSFIMPQRMGFTGKRVRCHQPADSQEEERLEPMKKKQRKMNMPENSPPSPPALPAKFQSRIRELRGCDVKFLMRKQLYDTDVNVNNNRLSMPLSQIQCEFLNEDEKAMLDQREGDKKRPLGMHVTLLDSCLREFPLCLKKWDMRSTCVYNLVQNWKNVLVENKLQSGHQLDIWSFRVHGNLYLVLNCEKSKSLAL